MSSSASKSNLDSEELVHLAIKSSEQNNNEDAILKLKQAIVQSPDNANAHFMLGAIYAELGMYERAQQCFQAAILANPELHIASFQSGLLQITSGELDSAKQVWSNLDSLGEDHYLVLFKNGMLDLAVDKHEQAVDKITKGLQNNNENPALNYDMERILMEIGAAFGYFDKAESDNTETMLDDTPAADLQPANDSEKSNSHVLLNRYKNSDDDTPKDQ